MTDGILLRNDSLRPEIAMTSPRIVCAFQYQQSCPEHSCHSKKKKKNLKWYNRLVGADSTT